MRLGLISKSQRSFYVKELKEILRHSMRTNSTGAFRRFVRRWILKGAPIDPAAFYAPAPSLAIVIRQLVVAFALPDYRVDAKLWLTLPDVRAFDAKTGTVKLPTGMVGNPKPMQECFIPWNLALYAPEGTPYASYNKIGLTLDYVSEDS